MLQAIVWSPYSSLRKVHGKSQTAIWAEGPSIWKRQLISKRHFWFGGKKQTKNKTWLFDKPENVSTGSFIKQKHPFQVFEWWAVSQLFVVLLKMKRLCIQRCCSDQTNIIFWGCHLGSLKLVRRGFCHFLETQLIDLLGVKIIMKISVAALFHPFKTHI